MKGLKKIVTMVLAFAMAFAFVPATQTEAATDEFPTKFRVYSWDAYEDREDIKVTDHHTYIANVKSKDKNLAVALTDYNYSSYGENTDTYTLAFLAKKSGTYDITYDVMKDSKKVKTVRAKVYVYSNPITVQLSGVKNGYYGKKKTAKLNVKALKGNTITKIEVGTYKTFTEKQNEDWMESERVNSELEYKQVKNNSTIKLGTKGYYHKEVTDNTANDRYYVSFQSDLMSETSIRVTYKDQYTKRNEQIEFWTYRGLAE